MTAHYYQPQLPEDGFTQQALTFQRILNSEVSLIDHYLMNGA